MGKIGNAAGALSRVIWCLLITLASANGQTASVPCVNCGPEESSYRVEAFVDRGPYATVPDPTCPQAVRGQVQQIANAVIGRGDLFSVGDPVIQYSALSAGLSLNANDQIRALGPPRDSRTASCQNVFLILPPWAEVTRISLGAGEMNGGFVPCAEQNGRVESSQGWRPCPIGYSGFEGPTIQRLSNAVLVYGTFRNWSNDRTRRAALTATFRPQKDFVLKPQSALPVEILYATSRKQSNIGYFGTDRGTSLVLGKAIVTIPPGHRKGTLESPAWWKLQFSYDANRDVMLQSASYLTERDFYSSIDENAGDQALVFVHGFNTTFENAIRTTAQIKYDLGFAGPAIAFSWPSLGKPLPIPYTVDATNAEWTVPFFVNFLKSISSRLGKKKIVLIAHSMGNRVLMQGMVRICNGQEVPSSVGKIVLAAPDLDREVFVDLASQFKHHNQHLTLYASSRDEALVFSKGVNGHIRAGDTTMGVTIAPDVDTIDVSNIETSFIGHSYYVDNRSIISDLYYLIRGVQLPRFGLQQRSFDGHPYWFFQP
jgi:esterase/lipase superfamily enzyme